MDFLYDHDRKLSDFESPDMTDILGTDLFNTPSMGVEEPFMSSSLTNFEQEPSDWFNTIFDEPGLVYNDKNLGEAANQPSIKNEHSYSTNSLHPSSPLDNMSNRMEETDKGALYNNTQEHAFDLSQKAQLIHAAATATQPSIKAEIADCDPILTTMTHGDPTTNLTHRPTTIILTTTTSSTTPVLSQAVFPNSTVQIKAEPMETYDIIQETVNLEGHTLIMPPTPPSSAGSDSDGSQSPQRSAPNSPQRQSPVRVYHYQHLLHHHSAAFNPDTGTQTLSQPLFLSPMPQSGVLILTEEEKRTLISEGYPIPSKLPLTKQEEKNLKKVRRKIKNKISAQESRRKKKEYLEQLEKRVEAYNHENSDLKKKVESLEKNNNSLLSQLKALQAMVGKLPRSAAASATQTGTVLMVLVLCFAVFLGGSGGGSGSSLNMGYSGIGPAPLAFQNPGPLRAHGPSMGPGVGRVEDTADDYTTPNLKSRVLMAFSKEEGEDWCDEYRPLVPWEREQSCDFQPEGEPVDKEIMPPPVKETVADLGIRTIMPLVNKAPIAEDESIAVVTVAVSHNHTEDSVEEYQAMMHPDIAVAPTLPHHMGGNFSSIPELETA